MCLPAVFYRVFLTGFAQKVLREGSDEFSGKFQTAFDPPHPLFFGKLYCNFSPKRPKKALYWGPKYAMFWIKNDPPRLWNFSENSSDLVAPPFPKCQLDSKFWHLRLFWWGLVWNLTLKTFWADPVKKTPCILRIILWGRLGELIVWERVAVVT